MYEKREIEGKGIGCIALQDITPGQLILKYASAFPRRFKDRVGNS